MYTRGWIDHAGIKELLNPAIGSKSENKLKFIQAGQQVSGRRRRAAMTPSGANLTSAGAAGIFALTFALFLKLDEIASAEPLEKIQQKLDSDTTFSEPRTDGSVRGEIALSEHDFSSMGPRLAATRHLGGLSNEEPALSDGTHVSPVSAEVDIAPALQSSENSRAPRAGLSEDANADILRPADVLELDDATENILAIQRQQANSGASEIDAPRSVPIPPPGSGDGSGPTDGPGPGGFEGNVDQVFAQVGLTVDLMISSGEVVLTELPFEEFQFFSQMLLVYASGWDPSQPAPENAPYLIETFINLYGKESLYGLGGVFSNDGPTGGPITLFNANDSMTTSPVDAPLKTTEDAPPLKSGDLFNADSPPPPQGISTISLAPPTTLLPDDEPFSGDH